MKEMNKLAASKKGEEIIRSKLINIILLLALLFVIVAVIYLAARDALSNVWDYTFGWIRK